jgi:hypothetical protein
MSNEPNPITQAIEKLAPKALAGVMLDYLQKHAQNMMQPQGLTPKQRGHVNNAVAELKAVLNKFMMDHGLASDPQAEALVGQILQQVTPHLSRTAPQAVQQNMSADDHLWDRLQKTPWLKKKPTAPPGATKHDFDSHNLIRPDEYNEMLASSMNDMVKLANAADDAGLVSQAAALDTALRGVKVMKAAQYEGPISYWMANSRAFEKAFKSKLDSGKNMHDAWFDVIDEYQESLLTDQMAFNEKYAAKKEVEKSEMGGGSSGGIMSGAMTEFSKSMEERATKEGKSVGQIYSEWLESHKAASSALMEKVAERLAAGDKPGVAFYEAISFFGSGEHAALTIATAKRAARQIKEASSDEALKKQAAELETKIAGFWDSMKSMFGYGGGMGGSWGDPGGSWMDKNFLPYMGGGQVVSLFQKIRYNWENVARPWLTGEGLRLRYVDRMEFNKHFKPLLDAADQVAKLADKAGLDLDPPQRPTFTPSPQLGNRAVATKEDLHNFSDHIFEYLEPFMDDQLALVIERRMQRQKPQGKPKPFRKTQPQAKPQAQPTKQDPWNPNPAMPSWRQPAAATRLAPHELSVVEKALAKHRLPEDVKTKLMQFVGGHKAASVWKKVTTAQMFPQSTPAKPLHPDAKPMSIPAPSTPSDLSDLGLQGTGQSGDSSNIRAVLQEFFDSNYPMLGFYVDNIMQDIDAEMGAKPAPQPAAAPAPAQPAASAPSTPAPAPAPAPAAAAPAAAPAAEPPPAVAPTREERELKAPPAQPSGVPATMSNQTPPAPQPPAAPAQPAPAAGAGPFGQEGMVEVTKQPTNKVLKPKAPVGLGRA